MRPARPGAIAQPHTLSVFLAFLAVAGIFFCVGSAIAAGVGFLVRALRRWVSR